MKPENDSHYVVLDTQRRYDRRPFDRFDRLAFALHALSILRPAKMRVALYSRGSDFRVEQGRELGANDDGSGHWSASHATRAARASPWSSPSSPVSSARRSSST